MRGIGAPLVGIKRPFSRKKGLAAFSISLTGLSTDSLGNYAQIETHAAISYTITPDNNTETVKWSNSPNAADAATFGTGPSPTSFASLSTPGDRLYLHVTDGGVTTTRPVPVRFAPGTAPNIADQSPWTAGVAITPINGAATGANLLFTYAATGLPAGLSINPSSGEIAGTPTGASSGTATVTATDQDGRTYADTFAWTAALPAVGSFGALTNQSFTKDTGDQTYTFAAATGTGLTWTYEGVFPGSAISLSERTFTFPTDTLEEQTGTVITVRAFDQYGRAIEQTFTLSITVPALGSLPAPENQTISEGFGGTYQHPAATGSGLTFTYAASNLPAGVAYNAANRTFTFADTITAGQLTVTYSATDQYGRAATDSPRSFTLTTQEVFPAPTIESFTATVNGDGNLDLTVGFAAGTPAGQTMYVWLYLDPAADPDPDAATVISGANASGRWAGSALTDDIFSNFTAISTELDGEFVPFIVASRNPGGENPSTVVSAPAVTLTAAAQLNSVTYDSAGIVGDYTGTLTGVTYDSAGLIVEIT